MGPDFSKSAALIAFRCLCTFCFIGLILMVSQVVLAAPADGGNPQAPVAAPEKSRQAWETVQKEKRRSGEARKTLADQTTPAIDKAKNAANASDLNGAEALQSGLIDALRDVVKAREAEEKGLKAVLEAVKTADQAVATAHLKLNECKEPDDCSVAMSERDAAVAVQKEVQKELSEKEQAVSDFEQHEESLSAQIHDLDNQIDAIAPGRDPDAQSRATSRSNDNNDANNRNTQGQSGRQNSQASNSAGEQNNKNGQQAQGNNPLGSLGNLLGQMAQQRQSPQQQQTATQIQPNPMADKAGCVTNPRDPACGGAGSAPVAYQALENGEQKQKVNQADAGLNGLPKARPQSQEIGDDSTGKRHAPSSPPSSGGRSGVSVSGDSSVRKGTENAVSAPPHLPQSASVNGGAFYGGNSNVGRSNGSRTQLALNRGRITRKLHAATLARINRTPATSGQMHVKFYDPARPNWDKIRTRYSVLRSSLLRTPP